MMKKKHKRLKLKYTKPKINGKKIKINLYRKPEMFDSSFFGDSVVFAQSCGDYFDCGWC